MQKNYKPMQIWTVLLERTLRKNKLLREWV